MQKNYHVLNWRKYSVVLICIYLMVSLFFLGDLLEPDANISQMSDENIIGICALLFIFCPGFSLVIFHLGLRIKEAAKNNSFTDFMMPEPGSKANPYLFKLKGGRKNNEKLLIIVQSILLVLLIFTPITVVSLLIFK